jgi:KAP family P-loop domain/Domain of unknown function (DUF4062)
MARVFVSSTSEDLEECRRSVNLTILRLGEDDISMEAFVEESGRPVDKSLGDVASCDVYIGIFAWRYGYIPPGHDRSITELEYRAAVQNGKPILAFLLKEDAPWPPQWVDTGLPGERIRALRAELAENRVVSFFSTPEELATLVAVSLANWLQRREHSVTGTEKAEVSSPIRPQAATDQVQTPNITSDFWTTGDQLGYRTYATAIAEFIQHPDTRPPCTIGIKAPWGAGKTSLMRMVQDGLDPPEHGSQGTMTSTAPRRRIHLTEASIRQVSGRSQWWRPLNWRFHRNETLDSVSNQTILAKLKYEAERSASSSDLSSSRRQPDGVDQAPSLEAAPPSGLHDEAGWRPTVWFNPWMYQSGEQVWAGLAHEVISQITGRMSPAEREHFWLALNLRRVDQDAVRRKIHKALFERLLPLLGLLAFVVVITIGSFLLRTILPTIDRTLELLGNGVLALGSITTFALGAWRSVKFFDEKAVGPLAGLLREPDYTGGWHKLLADESKGAYTALVRDPGYENRLGLLYLIQTDIQRVLDLVATDTRPLVVFIDDLDRCTPSTVVQVIEAINLFLAGQFPNCLFIIAMEPEVVAAHVEVAYQQLGQILSDTDYWSEEGRLGWRFLDKIVQLPLSLPPLDAQHTNRFTGSALVGDVDAFVEEQVIVDEGRARQVQAALEAGGQSADELARTAMQAPGGAGAETKRALRKTLSQQLRDDGPLLESIVNAVADVLDNNPREIKRFVNIFRFYAVIRQERQFADLPAPESLKQVAKLAALAVRWPWLQNALIRQIGTTEYDTVLALLEGPLEGVPSTADWATRKESLAKTIAQAQLPEKLQQQLLANDGLCRFVANDPKVAKVTSGFL